MKKILYPLLTLVMVLSLAIPLAGIAAAQDGEHTIYGIANTGDIYEADPTTGGYTWVGHVLGGVPTGGSGPNGLAYDQDTNCIFYTNYPASTTHLYYLDLDDASGGDLGVVTGEIACADFYDGNYYYIAGGGSQGFTDDLYEVEIIYTAGVPSKGTVTEYAGISGSYNRAYGFWGDIAIKDGVIYSFGSYDRGSHFDFFSVNCDGTDYSIIETVTYGYQLAFGPDGTLYGHNYSDGWFYTIEWTDDSVTKTQLANSSIHYTDMASGMTSFFEAEPGLEIVKEADFEGRATIGDTIDYTFEVTNTGNVPLTGLMVVDSLPVTVVPVDEDEDGFNDGDLNTDGILDCDPVETWYYTGTYGPLTEDDILSCLLENNATATAYYESQEVTDDDDASVPVAKIVNLWAGQSTDVGGVEIWNDSTTLYVTYTTEDGWVFTEIHLYVGSNEPPTNAPGQFPYDGGDAASFSDDTVIFEIPLADIDSYSMETNKKGKETGKMIPDGTPGVDPEDAIYVAAHAVVIKVEGDCEDPFWATGYSDVNQGTGWTSAGVDTSVAGERSIPMAVTGEPDAYSSDYGIGFFSLGEGGSIVVDFGYPIFNGDGAYDISVHEISGNRGDPTEDADVYVIVDGQEYYAGTVKSSDGGNGVGTIEIPGEFGYVDAVKIVDATDRAWHVSLGYAGDGYDVDAVDACYLIVQEETAWGGFGDEFENIKFFDDANWSNFIEYFVMTCPLPPPIVAY